MLRLSFNVNNWYWIVGGNGSQVFSSARGIFVPSNDATYLAWLASGYAVTNIASIASLMNVLLNQATSAIYAQAATALLTALPTFTTLADAQTVALAAASDYYNNLIDAGFTFQGNLYQISPIPDPVTGVNSQSNITSMGSLAATVLNNTPGAPAWPSGFTWIAANNSKIPMTAAVMYAFSVAVANYVSTCILVCSAIKEAIAAATTVAAVQAIDVIAGYPAATA